MEELAKPKNTTATTNSQKKDAAQIKNVLDNVLKLTTSQTSKKDSSIEAAAGGGAGLGSAGGGGGITGGLMDLLARSGSTGRRRSWLTDMGHMLSGKTRHEHGGQQLSTAGSAVLKRLGTTGNNQTPIYLRTYLPIFLFTNLLIYQSSYLNQ